MTVHVLLDTSNVLYAVTTDEAAADEWITFDPDYIALGPIEVDDFEAFNEVKEAFEEANEVEPLERDDED